MTQSHTAVAKLVLAAAASLVAIPASAQAQFETLERFGLQDVAEAANCVSHHIPTDRSVDFVQTYWGPAIKQGNSCGSSQSATPASTQNAVRPIFLEGLSICLKRRYTSDNDPWVRRIAYGTATIAAKGVQNWSSGKTLLQQYVSATVACQPKE